MYRFLFDPVVTLFGQRSQRKRDSSATEVFDEVRAGAIKSFGVFLRPFYATGRLNMTYPSLPTSQAPVARRIFFESQIVSALKGHIPIVALGKPGEEFGVGRLLVDDQTWKSVVSELMSNCSLIICVPSCRPGSKWELEEILRNSYLPKTVFLMPEEPRKWPSKWKELREDWDNVVELMNTNRVRFPLYARSGLLFSFNSSGLCKSRLLLLDSPRYLRKTFIQLVTDE